jgi:hypothetical protein
MLVLRSGENVVGLKVKGMLWRSRFRAMGLFLAPSPDRGEGCLVFASIREVPSRLRAAGWGRGLRNIYTIAIIGARF